MKIIQTINQNIPIWSILCGDHALRGVVNLISPKLLKEPDFLNPLENSLRYEVFKSKRKWMATLFGEQPSFGLVRFTCKELITFDTCFDHINFFEFVKKYDKAYKAKNGFSIERKKHFKEDFIKSKEDVIREHALMKKLERKAIHVSPQKVLNSSIQNEKSLSIALNRGLIIKKDMGRYEVIDGTHRLVAYVWSRWVHKQTKIPGSIYAFYVEAGL
jgi:hypothetical protein